MSDEVINQEENASNNGAKTVLNKSIISGMAWNKASDGTPVVCAILKDSKLNLNTKTTIRSYLTALSGPIGAIDFVKAHLEAGDVNILTGARIEWETTTYPAGTPYNRSNGETVIPEEDEIVDHITKVDLNVNKDLLLSKYLDEYDIQDGTLKAKIVLKNFEVEL